MIIKLAAAAIGAALFYIIEICCRKGSFRYRRYHIWLCCGAGAAAASYCLYRYEDMGALLTMFGFCCVLAAVTLTDLYHREIPDICCVAVIMLAFISVWTLSGLTVWERVAGSLCVSVPLLLTAIAVPGSFGGGDIKLMAACGLFLGCRITAVSAAAAILAAGVCVIYWMMSGQKKRGDIFAFGPFLSLGMLTGIIWGERLIQWYVS